MSPPRTLQELICENDEFGDILTGHSDDIIIMQYTGLKDENGIEIYEGDILADDYSKYPISWSESLSQWDVSQGDDTSWGILDIHYGCKVIGNIYENEDILNNAGG